MGTNPLQQEQRLGEIMIERGLLSEQQLAAALAEQRREPRPLGELLVSLGYVSSAAVSDALAEQKGWSGSGIFGVGNRLRRHLHAVPAESPSVSELTAPTSQPASGPAAPPAVTDQGRDGSAAALGGSLVEGLDELASDPMHSKADLDSDHAQDTILRLRDEITALQQSVAVSEAERERLRHELEQAQRSANNRNRRPPPDHTHKLFVPTATGYKLLDRSGPPPEVGTTVELSDGNTVTRYLVTKLTRPPLPDTTGIYAYLQRS